MSFLYADSFFLRVNYEDCIREFLHLFDAAQVLLQFFHFFSQSDDFFFRKYVERAVFFHSLDLFQSVDTALDRLEVGQHAAQPSFVNIEHTAALCLSLDRILSLLFGSYEKDVSAVCSDICHCFISLVYFSYGFLQVDDINTISLGIDVLRHLRVPSSGLMSEMYACFQ